jgi:hypothetical protein
MRKQKVILNKFERMLLESKFPTLKILLEEEEEKKDEGGGEEKKDEGGDAASTDAGGTEDSGSSSLDDLFGGGGDAGGEEGAEGAEGGAEDSDAAAESGDAAGGEAAAPADDGEDAKKAQKEKENAAIEKVAKTAKKVYDGVVSDVLKPGGDDFESALFGNRSLEMQESYRVRKQKNRIQENISKYLFKNVNMRKLSNKKNLSLGSNFQMNEKKLLRINHVINEASSVDEIINDKFWEENATVDLIVGNAINLTKHFQDLIDIPKLIMNSVAIKFGKQAAQESSENKNAENEYKLKLDEFIQKYATQLKQLPDYENYDTSASVFNASKPDIAATGAFSPGG